MNRRVALSALLGAAAIIIGYIEGLIPFSTALPGIKPGFSNAAVLAALFLTDRKCAFFTMLVKVTVCALLFTGFSAFIFSFSGALCAFAAMSAVKQLCSSGEQPAPSCDEQALALERSAPMDRGIVLTSVVGAIFHNIGQLLAAAAVMRTFSVLYLAPALIMGAIIFGYGVGLAAKRICKSLDIHF